ncbi:MAG: hypothetical protein ABIX01_03820 [Chitinophagaceae bacterium]
MQKALLAGMYRSLIGELQHSKTRAERDAKQVSKWRKNVKAEIPIQVVARGLAMGLKMDDIIQPFWSRTQKFTRRMPVDHKVEFQVRPISGGSWVDEPFNFELLDESSNSSCGPKMSANIEAERRRVATVTGDPAWLIRDLTFTEVDVDGGSSFTERWSHEDIIAGDHLTAFKRLPPGP